LTQIYFRSRAKKRNRVLFEPTIITIGETGRQKIEELSKKMVFLKAEQAF